MRRKKRRGHVENSAPNRRLLLEALETRRVLAGSLSGTVFSDLDQDGVRDDGDVGAVGVVVYVDSNQNQTRDGGEPFATTVADDGATPTVDEAGNFEILGVAAGTVEVLTEPGSNLRQSAPLTATTADGVITPFEVLPASHVSGPSRPSAISISPDGNLAVATWTYGERVTTYLRNPQDGRLAYLNSYTYSNPSLWGAKEAVFSPDGDYVYIPAEYDDAISVFSISGAGVLNSVQAVNAASLGINDLDGIYGIAITPDGSQLIASSRQADTVSVFSIDSSTGQLTLQQTLRDGVDGVTSLKVPSGPVITPDGSVVMIPSANGFASLFFDRDPATGTLTAGQPNTNFGSVAHGVISENGRFIFVATSAASIRVLERSLGTGQFSEIASVSTGTGSNTRLALSPDNTSLYYISTNESKIGRFSLDPQTGALTAQETLENNFQIKDFKNPSNLGVSPDGANVYVTTSTSGTIHTLDVNQGIRVASAQVVEVVDGQATQVDDFGIAVDSPRVESFVSTSPNPTSGGSVDFAITFTEPVTGVIAGDFRIANTTLSGTTVSGVTGGPTTYTVSVTAPEGEGDVGIQLIDFDRILDSDLIPIGGTGSGSIVARSNTVSVDSLAPQALSIVPPPLVEAGSSFVEFYVSFSEPVMGVDPSDFVTTVTGTTLANVASVSGTGSDYRVRVDVSGGDGTVALNLVDDDSILDTLSNPLAGAGTSGDQDGSLSGTPYAFTPPYVSGRIWYDDDRDGIIDPNEAGIAGQTVYADLNGNGSLDGNEPSAITVDDDAGTVGIDEAGAYRLENLASDASYEIRIDLSGGFDQTFPRDYPLDDASLSFLDSLAAGVTPDRSLDRIGSILVSPDGNQIYTTSLNYHQLTVFERDVVSRSFVKTQELRANMPNLASMYTPTDFVLTPDGRYGYLSAANNDLLFVFSRNLTTGQLTFVARYENGVDGIFNMDYPAALEVSGDGGTLYVAAASSNAFLTFEIDPTDGTLKQDPGTGLRTPRQAFYEGNDGFGSINNPRSISVAPDGSQVVVSAASDASLVVFDVHPGTNLLSHAETHSGVSSAYNTAFSPDGRFVYAAELYSGQIEVFERDILSGAWARLPVIDTGLSRQSGLAISPDGTSLYITNESTDQVISFDRDVATGGVTSVQSLDNVAPHDLLDAATSVVVSPDGRDVFVGAMNADAMTMFARRSSRGDVSSHAITTTYQSTDGVDFGLSIDYPQIESITTNEPTPSTSSLIEFTLTFSEDVTGFDATDIQFAPSTLVGSAVTNIEDGPKQYKVTVNPGTGQGPLILQVIDDETIIDGTSDPLYGPGPAGVVAQSSAIEVDLLPPTVISIEPIGSPITQATTLTFSVEFSENVAGVDLTDFQPFLPPDSGIVGASVTSVELTDPNSGDHLYTVTLTYTSGEGLVGISLVDDDSIVDDVTFPLAGVGPGNGNFDSTPFDVAFSGRISGRVVEDFDQDGNADLGEPGVVGARVFVDANDNGVFDDGESFVFSIPDDPSTNSIDESGNYFMTGLVPGDHSIGVVPPNGWTLTSPTTRVAASGTVTPIEVFKDGSGGINYLDEAAGVTESPDGNYLYVASYNDDSVTVFARDAATGRLTLAQQVVNGQGGVSGLLGAQSIAISRDGEHLYVASALDDALVMFERDLATGMLTYLGHLKDGIGGADGLNEAVSVQVSDSGTQVYVAAITDNSVAVFNRDPATGLLQFAQKLNSNTLGAFAVELSPNQRHVYVSAFNSDAITVYDRDLVTGLLSLRQTIRQSDTGVTGLDAASGISMSPDGKHLYVAGYASQGVTVLNRDLTTGELTFNQFIPDPFPVSNPYPISVLVSPDGNQVVAMFAIYDAIAIYDRDPLTGQLTLRQTRRDGTGISDGLNGAWDAEYSSDGQFLYVLGTYDDAIVVYDRAVGARIPTTVVAATEIGLTTNLGSFSAFNEVPAIDSVRYGGALPITTSSIDVAIEFTEPVFGFSDADLSLGGTLAGATISGVTGTGASYIATIAIPDDQGTLIVSVDNDGTITDLEGQAIQGPSVSLGPLDVDRADPAVVSIEPALPGPYSDYYIDFIVDFNESVTGVVKEDFTLIGTAVDAGVWSVNGSSTIPGRFYVEVRFGPELTSTIGIKFNDDDTVIDGVGRPVGGTGIGNGDFSSDLLQIDRDTEIEGTVWYDSNGDSILDDGEPRLVGVPVYLDVNGDGVHQPATEPSQLTRDDDPATTDIDEKGTYQFAGLPFNADYTVRVTHSSPDVQQTHPSKGRIFYEDNFGSNENLGYRERVMLLSNDDRFLYVVDTDDETLNVYEVSADQSERELIQVLRQGADGVGGIHDPRSLALSPTEDHLYTVGYDGDHVGVFSRDAATGLLTYLQVMQSGVDGVLGVYEPTAVMVSPDGRYVYAGSDTIGVFSRDLATGLLTYQTNIGDRSTISFREGVISNDGRFMYVARDGVALNTYQIDAATGVPTYVDSVAWCCGIHPQQGDHSIALSDDDRFLYSVSEDASELIVYSLDATTGVPTVFQKILNSDVIHDALNRPMSMELSHDGETLYVSGFYDATIALFDIDAATGTASILEAHSRYESPFHGGGNGIVETSDGKSLFLSARSFPSINLYRVSSGLGVAQAYELGGRPGVVYSGADFGFYDLPPAVVGIEPVVRNRESLPTADLRVTFSEPVEGVDETDFYLDVDGLSGASVQGVSGSGNEYIVTVNTGTILDGFAEGRLTLFINDDNSIVDGSGDPLGGAVVVAPLSYPSETIVIDRTAPTIDSIVRLDPEKTTFSIVDYSLRFSEAIVNLDASDFEVSTQGLAGVTVSEVSGVTVVNVRVATGTGSGTIDLQLRADHDLTDIAGNPVAIDAFSFASPSQIRYRIERGPTVTLSGTKFNDVNGNGVQDPTEPGVPGWTIFLDQNDNGIFDAGEPNEVTAADGSYSFVDLYSGQYDVAEVFQPAGEQSVPGIGGRDHEQISVNAGGAGANLGGSEPSLSGDGQLVAFVSSSTDIVAGSGSMQNVFVRNRLTGNTILISDSHDGQPSDGNSQFPVISANGRYVVYLSDATNLIEGDTNGKGDIFLHDLTTGITERISTNLDGTEADGHSEAKPDISSDGRYIVFASAATNLVEVDDNAQTDVFMLDRVAQTLEIVSLRNVSFFVQGDGPSSNPSVSDDGRYIAFTTNATNLGSVDNTFGDQVMIRDRARSWTHYVSSPTTNGSWPANSHSGVPKISDNGLFISYWSTSTNIHPDDSTDDWDLYWYSRVSGDSYLIYDSLQELPDTTSPWPATDISGDGRFIVFSTNSSDISNGDTNFHRDVYVHDRVNETMELVSVNDVGMPGNQASIGVAISNDGTVIAYDSAATNFVDFDLNGESDVFVTSLPPSFTPFRYRLIAEINDSVTDLNFADTQPSGVIAGKLWEDSNRDGVRQPGEPAIVGRNVFLDANGNQTFDVGEMTTASDSNGSYAFSGLLAGTYQPIEDLPADWLEHVPAVGDDYSTRLGSSLPLTIDFEEFTSSQTIGPYLNGPFELATTSEGPVHWSVESENNNEWVTPVVGNETTFLRRVDGRTFDLLSIDLWYGFAAPALVPITLNGTKAIGDPVEITLEPGSQPSTYPLVGFTDLTSVTFLPDASGFQFDDFVLSYDNWSATNLDFGSMVQTGSVNGVVWNDANSDGIIDATEDRLPTWSVFLDVNEDGVRQTDEPFTLTDGLGQYSFPNLEPGTHKVGVTLPAGWVSTTGGSIVDVLVDPGQTSTQNFGTRPLPSSIAGVVWMDDDADGVRDAGEPGIAGVTVYIDANNNGELDPGEDSQVSRADDPATSGEDETGEYLFDGLAPGEYIVRQVVPAGFDQTAPVNVTLQIAERYVTDFDYVGFQHHPSDDLRLSANGRYLVFATTKQMLAEDANTQRDIYLLDRVTDEYELISVNTAGAQGNANHFEPDVSEDGRYVIFRSGSTNLDPADTGGSHDIYIRDRDLNTTELLSKDLNGNSAAGHTADALISPDGNRVSFFSLGSNLVPGDTNGRHDTFLLDRTTGVYERVSVNPSGNQVTGASSWGADTSADGRYIVFQSNSSQLVAGDNNGLTDVFWRDLIENETRLVSTSSTGTQGNAGSEKKSVSDDGRWVAFDSFASNLTSDPHAGPGESSEIYLKDMATGTTKRISLSSVVGAYTGNSRRPEMSGDGRFIVFESDGMLVPGDTNQRIDIYLYDRLDDSMHLVSGGKDGFPSRGNSNNAVISADGGTIAFTTDSSNVTPGDPVPQGGIAVVETADLIASHRVDLPADTQEVDRDFGIGVTSGLVTGVVFDDIDANGTREVGENGLSGWDVFVDLNENGHFDVGEPIVTTSPDDPLTSGVDEAGTFEFPDLAFGDYTFVLLQKTGFAGTSPGNVAAVLAAGTAVANVDFAVRAEPSSISGALWDDIDANGLRDPGEAGLSGRTVFLDENGNQLLDGGERFVVTDPDDPLTLDTDEAGNYRFDNVPRGVHSLVQQLPIGWRQTSPSPTNFQLEELLLNGFTTGTNNGTNPYYDSAASENGQFVAFSTDRSMIPEDTNNFNDVYVLDRESGDIELVSVASAGLVLNGDANPPLSPPVGDPSNGASFNPGISADGRFVVFRSHGNNLVAADNNNNPDIFLHDRVEGTTTLISSRDPSLPGSASVGNSWSYSPTISGNGRYVSYWSNSSNLVSNDTNDVFDLFLKDLWSDTTERVNVAPDGGQAISGNTHYSELSHDGRYIAFWSRATNLVENDTNAGSDVFVRDLQLGVTERVSTNSNGDQSNAETFKTSLSDDGRYVVMQSRATNLTPDFVGTGNQVFLKDRLTGETRLVSRGADGAGGNQAAVWPSISGDGRWIVFHSWATNLIDGDDNAKADAFLYDVQNDTLELLSRGVNGEFANGGSEWARISRDGSLVTFNSVATNLSLVAPTEGALYAVELNNVGGDGLGRTFTLQAGEQLMDQDFGSQFSMDFGDAPASYGTTLTGDGARHAVVDSIHLGTEIEAESDSAAADNDLDDDGVAFQGPLIPGLEQSFTVTTSDAGTLAVWIDYDGSGTFENATERSEFSIANAGSHAISIAIPGGATEGASFARFRFSSDANSVANPTGIAIDGEVEDYAVSIASAPTVEQVIVNGGDPQRSSLDHLQVVFDRVVDLSTVTGSPVTVRNVDTGEAVTTILNPDNSTGKTILEVTFDPDGLSVESNGSLMNGNYELIIHSDGVSHQGMPLDGDGNLTPGGDKHFEAVDGLFRKYGDSNGNGVVDLVDFSNFRRTFGKQSTDSGFIEEFDHDGNDSIDLLDFAAFRRNFG